MHRWRVDDNSVRLGIHAHNSTLQLQVAVVGFPLATVGQFAVRNGVHPDGMNPRLARSSLDEDQIARLVAARIRHDQAGGADGNVRIRQIHSGATLTGVAAGGSDTEKSVAVSGRDGDYVRTLDSLPSQNDVTSVDVDLAATIKFDERSERK